MPAPAIIKFHTPNTNQNLSITEHCKFIILKSCVGFIDFVTPNE